MPALWAGRVPPLSNSFRRHWTYIAYRSWTIYVQFVRGWCLNQTSRKALSCAVDSGICSYRCRTSIVCRHSALLERSCHHGYSGCSASKARGLLSQFENGHTLLALVAGRHVFGVTDALSCSLQSSRAILCVVAWKLCNTHWHSCAVWH